MISDLTCGRMLSDGCSRASKVSTIPKRDLVCKLIFFVNKVSVSNPKLIPPIRNLSGPPICV